MINCEKDLISIIIPFYNENIYFDRCLQSALKQTYSNTEIIIINDGSNEECRNLLENLESKLDRYSERKGGVKPVPLRCSRYNKNYTHTKQ